MQETQHGAQAKVDKHAKTPHPTSATLGGAGGSLPAGASGGQTLIWSGSLWVPGATTGAAIATSAALDTTVAPGTAGSTGNASDAGHAHRIGAHADTHAPNGSDPLNAGPGLNLPGYVEPISAAFFSANATLTSGSVYLSMFTARSAIALTKLLHDTRGGAVSSGLTLARMGIVSLSGTTYTLLARTASDTTLGNTLNSEYTRALDATGTRQDGSTFPTSLTLTKGGVYGLALLYVGTTMPNCCQGGAGMTTVMGGRIGARSLAGQTDIPLAFDNASVNNVGSAFYQAATV